MSRQSIYTCAVMIASVVLLSSGAAVLTARQEGQKAIVEPPGSPAERKELPPPGLHKTDVLGTRKAAEDALSKIFADYDLKPHGLPAIPDNPPPHEGAMIDYPVIIEPPDLLLIEVLEALPGRPISGERLVRPDGYINLGFYGDVHVAGLTLKQAKVKIIQHLRHFLSDEVLGLYEILPGEEQDNRDNPEPPKVIPQIPEPPNDRDPFKIDQEKRPRAENNKPRTSPTGFKVRSVQQGKALVSYYGRSRPTASVRLVKRVQEQEQKKAEESQQTVSVPLQAGGKVMITVEVQSGEKKEKEKDKEEISEVPDDWVPGPVKHPEDSDRVFLDITAYNSKNYYLEGDLATPGRLPFTGHETVMDALEFGGGLVSTAEPKDIRLVRPARGGKPARIYKIDLEAIRERGDLTYNYQIFPGDRLIVGRNEVVKKTMQLDRLAMPMQTITTAISQESSLLRSLQTASPENHEAILKGLVDFWIQQMKRPDGVVLDEQALREALIRQLKAKPEKK